MTYKEAQLYKVIGLVKASSHILKQRSLLKKQADVYTQTSNDPWYAATQLYQGLSPKYDAYSQSKNRALSRNASGRANMIVSAIWQAARENPDLTMEEAMERAGIDVNTGLGQYIQQKLQNRTIEGQSLGQSAQAAKQMYEDMQNAQIVQPYDNQSSISPPSPPLPNRQPANLLSEQSTPVVNNNSYLNNMQTGLNRSIAGKNSYTPAPKTLPGMPTNSPQRYKPTIDYSNGAYQLSNTLTPEGYRQARDEYRNLNKFWNSLTPEQQQYSKNMEGYNARKKQLQDYGRAYNSHIAHVVGIKNPTGPKYNSTIGFSNGTYQFKPGDYSSAANEYQNLNNYWNSLTDAQRQMPKNISGFENRRNQLQNFMGGLVKDTVANMNSSSNNNSLVSK